MSRARPKLVVTLPARTVQDIAAELRLAKDSGADAAEVRLDRLEGTERAQLGRLFPAPLPLIGTYRSRAEGGDGSDEATERASVLLRIAAHPFRWIDLEVGRDLPVVPQLPPPEQLGRIYSCHLDASDPTVWRARLRELESVDGVGKLVVRASVGETLGELCTEAERVGEDVVLLTTGPGGPLLRLWSGRFGFPFVYAALPPSSGVAPVEPSQLPVDQLRAFLEAPEPGPLFAICGRPVTHSSSPAIHTRWMRAGHHAGMYVALEFHDDREFLDSLGPLANGGFRGVNVTHPFKSAAAAAATELGPGAAACGAANFLSFADGGVFAENTEPRRGPASARRAAEQRRVGRAVARGGRRRRGRPGDARGRAGARGRGVRVRPASGGGAPARADVRRPRTDGADGRPGLLGGPRHRGRSEPGRGSRGPSAAAAQTGGRILDWVYAPASPEVRLAAERAGASYRGRLAPPGLPGRGELRALVGRGATGGFRCDTGRGGTMRGVATTRAAISIVNALPLGIGAAVAIDWPVRSTARLRPRPGRRPSVRVLPRSSSTPIARAAGLLALRRYCPAASELLLEVRSTIPAARGLKSSSAVGGGIVRATARAAGESPRAEVLARLTAQAEADSGGSATGAFDDALASVGGGAVVTDNRTRRPLRRLEIDRSLRVALWVPDRPHPPSASVRARFRRQPALAQRAVDAALDGDWVGAMTANSALVECAMSYRYASLHVAVRRAGAVAAGVSGMGPTFAALAPASRLLRVARALPLSGGRRRTARLFFGARERGTRSA